MRVLSTCLCIVALFLLVACQDQAPACQWGTGTPHYLEAIPEAMDTPTPNLETTLIPVEIGRKTILVDKVVEGPLCNESWGGTVYVTCDVQVLPWVETPTFLKDCNLAIEPETVVYVEYHNNTAYYNGCSCHTGELPDP